MKMNKENNVKTLDTYYKNSEGVEYWKEYNEQGKEIHYKYTEGSIC